MTTTNDEILALVEERLALSSSDKNWWNMPPGCYVIRPSGNPLTNEGYKAMKASGNVKVISDKLITMHKIHVVGDAAFAVYTAHTQFEFKGTPNDDVSVFTSIFQKLEDKWVLVHSHRSSGRKPTDLPPKFVESGPISLGKDQLAIQKALQSFYPAEKMMESPHVGAESVTIRPSGNPMGKSTWEGMIASPDVEFGGSELVSIEKIEVCGDMAFAVYVDHSKFTFKGTTNDDCSVWTGVFKRGVDKEWKYIHGQRSTGRKPGDALPDFNKDTLRSLIANMAGYNPKWQENMAQGSCVIRPTGNPMDQAAWESMQSSDVEIKETKLLSIQKLEVIGDFAYSVYVQHTKFNYKGDDNDDVAVLSGIYQKFGGIWACIHAQRSTGRKPTDEPPFSTAA
jgi:ketosteroid isomerase-like protein